MVFTDGFDITFTLKIHVLAFCNLRNRDLSRAGGHGSITRDLTSKCILSIVCRLNHLYKDTRTFFSNDVAYKMQFHLKKRYTYGLQHREYSQYFIITTNGV